MKGHAIPATFSCLSQAVSEVACLDGGLPGTSYDPWSQTQNRAPEVAAWTKQESHTTIQTGQRYLFRTYMHTYTYTT